MRIVSQMASMSINVARNGIDYGLTPRGRVDESVGRAQDAAVGKLFQIDFKRLTVLARGFLLKTTLIHLDSNRLLGLKTNSPILWRGNGGIHPRGC